MKLGVLIRAYQDLHTEVYRKRDFTGNLERMSTVTSKGRLNVAIVRLESLFDIALLLLLVLGFMRSHFQRLHFS